MTKDSTTSAEQKLIQDVEQILGFNKKLAPVGTQRMFVSDSCCESLIISIRSRDSEIQSLEAKLKIAREALEELKVSDKDSKGWYYSCEIVDEIVNEALSQLSL